MELPYRDVRQLRRNHREGARSRPGNPYSFGREAEQLLQQRSHAVRAVAEAVRVTQRRWWQDVVIQAAGSLLAAGVIAIVAVLFGVIGSTTLRIVFGVVLIAWTLSLIVIAALFLGTPREARFYVRMYDGWQRRPRVKQLREWRRG